MAPLLLTLCAGTALLFSPARASVPAPRPQLRVAAPQLAANGEVAAVTKVSTPTLSVAIFKNLIGAGVFLIPAGVVRVGLAPALLALHTAIDEAASRLLSGSDLARGVTNLGARLAVRRRAAPMSACILPTACTLPTA